MFNFLLEGTGNGLGMLIPIAVLILVFWLFMIRPQKKQEQRDAEMRNALDVGDEVTTIGGIIGKVVSIKGETFVLETTRDKTKIRFLKGAIRSVDVKAADIAAAVLNESTDATDAVEDNTEAVTELTDTAELNSEAAADNADNNKKDSKKKKSKGKRK